MTIQDILLGQFEGHNNPHSPQDRRLRCHRNKRCLEMARGRTGPLSIAILLVLGLWSVPKDLWLERAAEESSKTANLEARVAQLEAQVAAMAEDRLPDCAVLMQQPDSPLVDGDFITRPSTPHQWTSRIDGSQQLDLAAMCRLKRYTSEEARHCLAGKHVNFIGDSLTRYQTLSLMYLLHKGQYPPRFARDPNCTHIDEHGAAQCSPPSSPNVCSEIDWSAFGRGPRPQGVDLWMWYHSELGGGEDGGIFEGRFECNCARRKARIPNCQGGECVVENFYYASPGESNQKVRVTFMFELGWGQSPLPLHGFEFTKCAETGKCRRDVTSIHHFLKRAESHDVDWSDDLLQALQPGSYLHAHLPPVDIVVYNRGLWGALSEERYQNISTLLPVWGQRCFFKTTTASARVKATRESELSFIRAHTEAANCSMYDVAHLTSEFVALPKNSMERANVYWDALHFQPWVYEELNNVLLNVLCNGR